MRQVSSQSRQTFSLLLDAKHKSPFRDKIGIRVVVPGNVKATWVQPSSRGDARFDLQFPVPGGLSGLRVQSPDGITWHRSPEQAVRKLMAAIRHYEPDAEEKR